ncbi:Cytoplasmic protein required for sporulation [Saccharomyces cerevisiae]|nr:Cytoplasmic protein required for sporulation [Saccharomyces boulardii (nom. inval.)]
MVDSNDDQPERHALLHNDIQTSNNSRPSLVQKKYLPTPQDTRKSRASYTGSAMIKPDKDSERLTGFKESGSWMMRAVKLLLVDKHPDLFIFEYGVVVMWGFTEREEKAFLNDIEKFEKEKLAEEDIQVEEFNYYVTKSYQPRIYNDFITLRDGSNYMVKLSISHAIAQSVKISLFEELVDNTIEDTQDIPQEIAYSGKVSMSKEDIMKSIGELFILRININLHGSVLDSPEIMWSEPQLEPIYQATRGYLEINQRVSLLNQRLEVISDLLQMLKEQLGHSHEEYLNLLSYY